RRPPQRGRDYAAWRENPCHQSPASKSTRGASVCARTPVALIGRIPSGPQRKFATHDHCSTCCLTRRLPPFAGTAASVVHRRLRRKSSSAFVSIATSSPRTDQAVRDGRRGRTKH